MEGTVWGGWEGSAPGSHTASATVWPQVSPDIQGRGNYAAGANLSWGGRLPLPGSPTHGGGGVVPDPSPSKSPVSSLTIGCWSGAGTCPRPVPQSPASRVLGIETEGQSVPGSDGGCHAWQRHLLWPRLNQRAERRRNGRASPSPADRLWPCSFWAVLATFP